MKTWGQQPKETMARTTAVRVGSHAIGAREMAEVNQHPQTQTLPKLGTLFSTCRRGRNHGSLGESRRPRLTGVTGLCGESSLFGVSKSPLQDLANTAPCAAYGLTVEMHRDSTGRHPVDAFSKHETRRLAAVSGHQYSALAMGSGQRGASAGRAGQTGRAASTVGGRTCRFFGGESCSN